MNSIKYIFKSLKSPVENRNGAYGISLFAIVISVSLLTSLAFGFKLYSTYNIVNNVHEAMNKIVTTAVTNNSEESYANKRESYTGAYQSKTDADILALLSEEEIKDRLTDMLALNTPAGKELGKYEDTGSGYVSLYHISDIKVEVKNPEMKKNGDYIEAEISLELHIPFKIGGFVNKSNIIDIKLTAKGTDAPKF